MFIPDILLIQKTEKFTKQSQIKRTSYAYSKITTFHYTTDCAFMACEHQMVTLNGEQQKEASSHH